MRIRILFAMTAAALLVAGCSDDDGDVATTTTTSTAVAVATTVGVTTSAAPAVTTSSTPVASAIILGPDGLGVASFGDGKDATISALSAVLGPLDETGTGCELGGPGTTTARWKELRVEFSAEGVFRSYDVRPTNNVAAVLDLETEAGVGLGSTVAELEAVYASRLTIPSLPPAFGGKDFAISFVGTERALRGSLSDTAPSGTVTGFFTSVCE